MTKRIVAPQSTLRSLLCQIWALLKKIRGRRHSNVGIDSRHPSLQKRKIIAYEQDNSTFLSTELQPSCYQVMVIVPLVLHGARSDLPRAAARTGTGLETKLGSIILKVWTTHTACPSKSCGVKSSPWKSEYSRHTDKINSLTTQTSSTIRLNCWSFQQPEKNRWCRNICVN